MISFITVNYKSHKIIDALLSSIQTSHFISKKMEVVVYDNYSTQQEQSDLNVVCEKYPFAKLVLAKDNLGFAIGNNRAVEKSSGDILFFINPDCILSEAVYKGFELFCQKEYDASVFPMIDETGSSVKYLFKYPFLSYFLKNDQSRWCTGANLLIKRDVFNKVGGWPEDYFMYSEDTDMHFTLKNKGVPVNILQGFNLMHIGNACAGEVWSSVKRESMLYRSMLKFSKKYNKRIDFMLYYWLVTFCLIIKKPQLFKLRIKMLKIRDKIV